LYWNTYKNKYKKITKPNTKKIQKKIQKIKFVVKRNVFIIHIFDFNVHIKISKNEILRRISKVTFDSKTPQSLILKQENKIINYSTNYKSVTNTINHKN